MNVEIWHVEGTRFHFGRHGLGQEKSGVHFPSDSLFAALVAQIALSRGAKAVEEFTAPFMGDSPPFVLTSAFPRVKNTLFFPPPLRTGEEKTDSKSEAKPKKLKKVAYLSEAVFREVIAGVSLGQIWKDKAYRRLHAETVLVKADEDLPKARMWKIARQPRVTIDRIANNSAIYHTGQVLFNHGDGLWFGIRWLVNDPALKKEVENALIALGDAGLGGERSSGYGVCKITPHAEIQLPEPAGKLWTSLSRFIPKEEEISALSHPEAAYQIESIGGWVRSVYGKKDERRKKVQLIAEGAVLGALETLTPGMMVDAQPSYEGKEPLGHPVYRNGFALGVGLGKGD